MEDDMSKCDSNNYKFFQHKKCEFFPCHNDINEDEFNCLFCFCPLYALGENCGGKFKILENGCKDCCDCSIPHCKNGYDYIMKRFDDILKIVKEQKSK